jgi:probable LLM family oxidoreductase
VFADRLVRSLAVTSAVAASALVAIASAGVMPKRERLPRRVADTSFARPATRPADCGVTRRAASVRRRMELGLVTFADLPPHLPAEERMRNLLEEAKLADELGLSVFAIGEHHRPDYLVSSPATALAAVAAVTERIRLSSAVTVLSSDDPVRVFQQFAHVDLISGGRAEIMAGRGSFIESFPLFGYDLREYDELFTEKLELLLAVRDSNPVTWSGTHRPPLENAVVWPRPVQDSIPIWVAVGGSPESVVRAARLGLPLTLAIIGGRTYRFKPFVELYRRAWAEAGHEGPPELAINTHAFVADSEEAADDAFAATYLQGMNRIGRERGWPPSGRAEYEALKSEQGPLTLGSPEQVAAKIVGFHELFQPDRYLAHISIGAVEHADVLRAIELFGTRVAPLVREAVDEPASSAHERP